MSLQADIESAFEGKVIEDLPGCLQEVISGIESGALRVAEKGTHGWLTHDWIKKALILVFKTFEAKLYSDGVSSWFDRIAPRFHGFQERDFRSVGARVSPGAVVRAGTYIGRNVILMPSFVNIGAYVGDGTMIDTWATVGSCAQVGRSVHISGGAGIGGVLEPAQAIPTIVEDGCFIGARSEVVEGVIVEESSVIGMGVFLGQSTPIYDRDTRQVTYGRIPAGSVVVSGVLNRDGYGLNAAIIVKRVDAKTRAKTSVTDLLRGV